MDRLIVHFLPRKIDTKASPLVQKAMITPVSAIVSWLFSSDHRGISLFKRNDIARIPPHTRNKNYFHISQ